MKPSLFKRIPACFPVLLAPNRDREIGSGRATRQPGQVRKEAALTSSGSGRSSVSHPFSQAAQPMDHHRRRNAAILKEMIADRPMNEPGTSASADQTQTGFELGSNLGTPATGAGYRVL